MLDEIFYAGSRKLDVLIPYTMGDLLDRLHGGAVITSESYEADGTHIVATCPAALADYVDSRLSGKTSGQE
jgi:GTP-binding protein HflX